MHGSGGTVSPSGGSITTGPACNLNRGGGQASFRSTVSDTEVETLQVSLFNLKIHVFAYYILKAISTDVHNVKCQFHLGFVLCIEIIVAFYIGISFNM